MNNDMMMRRTAESGNAAAQFNLGVLHYSRLARDGETSASDRVNAFKWLGLAAAQGYLRAQTKLGEAYAEGPDTPRSHMNACAWYYLAAMGSPGAYREIAQTGYDRAAAHLTAAQVAAAQRLARLRKGRVERAMLLAG